MKAFKTNTQKFTVDIETATTHTYQLSDGTISHNTAACILGTSSGIHPHHAKNYLRRAQANDTEAPVNFYAAANPRAVEKSVWNPNGSDVVLTFCIEAKKTSITKQDLTAVDMLNYVKLTKENWVDAGKRIDMCAQPWLSHNVSNTVSVKDKEWDSVTDFIYDNRSAFAGISLLSSGGDLVYNQAPFTEILSAGELVKTYGKGAVLASGLIVAGANTLRAFNGDLWKACDALLSFIDQSAKGICTELIIPENTHPDVVKSMQEVADKKQQWIDAAVIFSNNYFRGDHLKMTYCLKSVQNFKLWHDLRRDYKAVDYVEMIETTDETKVGAEPACAGGSCDII